MGIIEQIRFVNDLKNSKLIKKKHYDGITSYNFTKKALYDKNWNEITTKARGLFVYDVDDSIAARSYDKFFNINEMPETDYDKIKRDFAYPVSVYRKENGFLGMFSYNKLTDEPLIATKSSLDGDFRDYFIDVLDTIKFDYVAAYNICRFYDVTLVFEVITPVDKHIINYGEVKKVVLLEVIRNDFKYEAFPYDKLSLIAEMLDVPCKKRIKFLSNIEEFEDFYNEVNNTINEIEGYVLEDKTGFKVKLKTPYYNFWKYIRRLMMSKDNITYESIDEGYVPDLYKDIVFPVVSFYSKNKDEIKDVIDLREKFNEGEQL